MAGQLTALAGLAAVPEASNRMPRAIHTLLDWVFPPRCACCGRPGAAMCASCLAQVRKVPWPLCQRCGRPIRQGERCQACRSGDFCVSAIRAAGLYVSPLSRAVQALKYRGRTDLAAPLGGLLAQYWTSRPVAADLVVAVPLHDQRLRERGFNQAHLLAFQLCQLARMPLVQPGVLCRHRATQQQVQLGPVDRWRNVDGAFVWIGPALGGARVLLVDDVATTGATLEACAKALRTSGAGAIWALTVARAGYADDDRLGETAAERARGEGVDICRRSD